MAIIKSTQWKDALKNESLESASNKQTTTPLRQLIEKMPSESCNLLNCTLSSVEKQTLQKVSHWFKASFCPKIEEFKPSLG